MMGAEPEKERVQKPQGPAAGPSRAAEGVGPNPTSASARETYTDIKLAPVGFVRTSSPDEAVSRDWMTLESEIEILPQYEPALAGIDGFSHLIVLFFIDKQPPEQRNLLQVKPRGLVRYGLTMEELPTIGVFACDSPRRPNPIGVSVVEVIERRGTVIKVKGLDAFDGSPVLDIKPYTRDRAVNDLRVPSWHADLLQRTQAPRV